MAYSNNIEMQRVGLPTLRFWDHPMTMTDDWEHCLHSPARQLVTWSKWPENRIVGMALVYLHHVRTTAPFLIFELMCTEVKFDRYAHYLYGISIGFKLRYPSIYSSWAFFLSDYVVCYQVLVEVGRRERHEHGPVGASAALIIAMLMIRISCWWFSLF